MSQTTQTAATFPGWTLGDRLRKVRETIIGLTAKEWAAKIDVSRQTVANYESDKYKPSHLYLIALSQAADLPIEEILGPYADDPDGNGSGEQGERSTNWYMGLSEPDGLINLSALEKLSA